MKIITVTANPAVDVIYALNGDLTVGGLNRTKSSAIYAGGKGINVSRAVVKSGGETVACTMLGGYVGGLFEEMLRDEGISVIKTPTKAETRVNICVVSQNSTKNEEEATEINASGGPVGKSELEELTKTVTEQASSGDVVILAGSIPKYEEGDGISYFTALISRLREKGCTVILDASGDGLRSAVEGYCPPHLIKPNLHELGELIPSCFDHPCTEREQCFRSVENASEILASRGISVLCTLGSLGAVFTSSEDPTRHIRQPSVPVSHVANVKGAGDTFLGVFVHRHFILNENIESSLAKAANAASAHVGGR